MSEVWDEEDIGNAGGIFGNNINHVEKPKAQLVAEGVKFEFFSDGTPHGVVIEYPEIIAIKYRVPPQNAFRGTNVVQSLSDWVVNRDGSWSPRNVTGPKGQPLLSITSAEADHLIDGAYKGGLIDAEAVTRISNHCAGVARQMAQQGVRF